MSEFQFVTQAFAHLSTWGGSKDCGNPVSEDENDEEAGTVLDCAGWFPISPKI